MIDEFDKMTINEKTSVVHREMFRELLTRYKSRGKEISLIEEAIKQTILSNILFEAKIETLLKVREQKRNADEQKYFDGVVDQVLRDLIFQVRGQTSLIERTNLLRMNAGDEPNKPATDSGQAIEKDIDWYRVGVRRTSNDSSPIIPEIVCYDVEAHSMEEAQEIVWQRNIRPCYPPDVDARIISVSLTFDAKDNPSKNLLDVSTDVSIKQVNWRSKC